MKINFYTFLLCYAILFNTMNPMFNYYYLIFTVYLLWVFPVATNSPLFKNLCPHKSTLLSMVQNFLYYNIPLIIHHSLVFSIPFLLILSVYMLHLIKLHV